MTVRADPAIEPPDSAVQNTAIGEGAVQPDIEVRESQRNRSLVSQSLTALLITAGGAGLSFFMFVGIARTLDIVSFGLVSTAFSLATFAAASGSLGQRVVAVRLVSAYDEQGLAQERTGIIRFGYVVLGAGTLFASALAALWARGEGTLPSNLAFLGGVIALAMALGLADYQTRIFRPLSGVVLTLLPKDIVWRSGVLLVGVLAALMWPAGRITPTNWIWVLAAGLLAVTAFQSAVFDRRHRNLSPFRGAAVFRSRSWGRESISPWLAGMVLTGAPSLAVVFVGVELSIADSGPFFATVRVAALLTLFTHAIEVVLSPSISRDLVAERNEGLQRSARSAALLGFGFALAVWLVFLVAGDKILDLFRSGFGSHHTALIVLGFGYLINTACGPTAPLMLMSGRARKLAQYQVVSWGIGLAVLIPAIRLYGTVGAAFALAAADIGWNLAARRHIVAHMGIEPTILSTFRQPNLEPIEVNGSNRSD